MRVICTAGHVDHGKSALVRALTGTEPDRFAEEHHRGLTIDLGFAWTDLGDPPQTVAFVDLPGHERFVGNMLAGAGAVDLALFVVAADEGWMPQSQEHLDILDLLGVTRGLVALTKADLVDEETMELGRELVREQLGGSVFADVEVIPVSARTGMGLENLSHRLVATLDQAPPPPDHGRPRLWVDRSFTIRGAGTVVTGTLSGGGLSTGDEVAVLPGPRRERASTALPSGRVRGLQALKHPVDHAPPGSRVAVNVSGVEREDVGRGQAVTKPGQWLTVHAFDASARALPGWELDRTGAWHVHVGSGERLARLFPVAARPIADTGYLRVELDVPAALTAGDRFVIREAGRQATLGGGVVLDPDPPARPRGDARVVRAAQLDARREALAEGDRTRLLECAVRERGAVQAGRAAAAVGLADPDAAKAAAAHGLWRLGDAWVHPDAAAQWEKSVADALAAYHRGHPVERAAPKDVATRAAGAAGCPPELIEPLLSALVERGSLAAERAGLRIPDHTVEFDAEQARAREALLAELGAEPFAPPTLATAAERAGASTALIRELEAAGELVRLGPDLAVTAAALDDAAAALRGVYGAEGAFTASRAKDALGTSRKYAMPLLEELDRRGLTRRRGDLRDVVG